MTVVSKLKKLDIASVGGADLRISLRQQKGSTMVLLRSLVVLFFALSPALTFAAADIMFEGYYRVELEGKPIGFTIQRYEFDKKNNTFISTYSLKIKIGVS